MGCTVNLFCSIANGVVFRNSRPLLFERTTKAFKMFAARTGVVILDGGKDEVVTREGVITPFAFFPQGHREFDGFLRIIVSLNVYARP